MVDQPKYSIFYGSLDEDEDVIATTVFGIPKSYVEVEGFAFQKPTTHNYEFHIPLPTCTDSLKFYGIDNNTMRVSCPDSKCHRYSQQSTFISAILVHLNDHHKWSFKQIGQWLEGLGL